MGTTAELPECLSIIVCDDIYRDEETKKLVIVGTFNNIKAAEFPCRHGQLSVLFTLTNGRGAYDLALGIEHAESGCALIEMRGPLTLEDPLQIADFNVKLAGVEFPAPGKYWVCVRINGELVRQRPFLVRRVGE